MRENLKNPSHLANPSSANFKSSNRVPTSFTKIFQLWEKVYVRGDREVKERENIVKVIEEKRKDVRGGHEIKEHYVRSTSQSEVIVIESSN